MTTVKYTIMIGEILQKVDDAKTKKAKKDILIKYSEVKDLKHYLRGLFDPKVQWAINEEPDYKPDIVTPEGEEANSLYVEMPLCSIFVKGHKACENLKPERQKQLLVQILESLHDSEAQLYMQMLKKKTKIKGLTSKLVLEVWPGMYKEEGV
jgi:hypothetical protein